MSNASMNMGIQASDQVPAFNSFGCIPEAELHGN